MTHPVALTCRARCIKCTHPTTIVQHRHLRFSKNGWSNYTVSDVGGGINAVGMYLSGEEGAVVNYVGVVSDHVGSDGGSVEVMLATAATT
eukprot:scaffold1541_cov144-Alexandrium_tamarense.AAC.1